MTEAGSDPGSLLVTEEGEVGTGVSAGQEGRCGGSSEQEVLEEMVLELRMEAKVLVGRLGSSQGQGVDRARQRSGLGSRHS